MRCRSGSRSTAFSWTPPTRTAATFGWDIDTGSTHVPDGTYLISVTAFDAEGIPGPTRSRTMRLNRDAPAAPADVFGGWNPRADFTTAHDIVEIQWARNTEPDVIGYRVYRAGRRRARARLRLHDQPAHGPHADRVSRHEPARRRDRSTTTWWPWTRIRAGGAPREGAHSATLTATRATTKPNQPPTLSAMRTTTRSCSRWDAAPAPTPPYSGSDMIFYRVYRDGTAIGTASPARAWTR